MKTFVEYIAKNIVDNPDKVKVTEKVENDTIYLELLTMSEDVGKIVGKSGQTVKALRTILNASATKMKKKVLLDVKEITADDETKFVTRNIFGESKDQ